MVIPADPGWSFLAEDGNEAIYLGLSGVLAPDEDGCVATLVAVDGGDVADGAVEVLEVGDVYLNPVPVDYKTMRFETPEFDVPPGDSFECFYLDAFSEKEMAVIGSDGQQDKGGHHILLYWTDTPQDPQHHPCDDAEMLTWRQNCPPNRGKSRLPARCSMIHSNSCVAWRCDHV